MPDVTMTINGKSETSTKTFHIVNPATEEVFAVCPDCSRSQLDAAMSAARDARPKWQKDETERRRLLKACTDALKSKTQELAELLTREQGKTLKESLMEVSMAINRFTEAAQLAMPYELVMDNNAGRVEVLYRPIGVIGIISPWNAPLILGFGKTVLALMAGNTVVLKPSSFTPLTTLKIGEILRDILPAGVLNIVSGGSELGKWITNHKIPGKISFTGSVEVGRMVAQAASKDFKRVLLELGGNDPAIVLPDVNIKKTAPKLCHGAFLFAGQVCMAIKRVYAHEQIFDSLVKEIVAITRDIKLGNGLTPGVDMGPLNNPAQLEWVEELVTDAKRQGAQILTGGNRTEGPGYFFEPTIVTGISDGSRLVDEEQFGPVLPIMPFKSIDDAINRSNNSHFGLGGSIWTKDLEKGAQLAARLECGTGWVNQHMFGPATAPFGGWKWSGIGRHLGRWGLASCTEMQTISVIKA